MQRSLDRESWSTIGQVQAMGNSASATHYAFADKAPHEGHAYYRLVVVDVDASEAITPWVMVEWEAPVLHCWPNPATGLLLVDLGEHIDRATIHILDPSGRPVTFRQQRDDDDEVRIDLNGLPAGPYWIRVSDGEWVRTARVVLAPMR